MRGCAALWHAHRACYGYLLPHLHRDWSHPCHICTGTGLTPATSALGLGLTAATSAPRPGSPLPHLHRGTGAHPVHSSCTTAHTANARPGARTWPDRVAPTNPAAVLVGMHSCAAATIARCLLCVCGVLHRRCTTSPTCDWWTSHKATPRRRTIDGEGDVTETNAARDIRCRAARRCRQQSYM